MDPTEKYSTEDDLQAALGLLRNVVKDLDGVLPDTEGTINEFLLKMEQPVVKVVRYDSPSNPFTEFDCEVPILVAYLDHAGYSMHEYGVEDRLPHLPDEVVQEHEKEMLEAVGWKKEEQFTTDSLRNEYDNCYHEQSAEDRLDLLAKVYGWLGVTAHVGSSTGYSQGDYVRVLAVATPEWVEKTGAPQASLQSQCEGAIKLYGWWAWGDVWGYTIETRGGKDLGSCWGFFGDSLEETGLLDNVAERYREALREAWERRFE